MINGWSSFVRGGLCAAVIMYVPACTSAALRAPLRLDGGFIQYQPWMAKLDERAWQQELEAMRKARMQTIVLQQLQHETTRYIPDSSAAPDPTGIILSYADAHGMEVFIGLAVDSGWWKCGQWQDYLDAAALKNMALADEIWKRYGSHRSFVGWYLPQEMWEGPFTDEQVALARHLFHRLSDHCRSLSKDEPKPVALSPFHTGRVPPSEIEKLYRDLLRGSGVNIVMLQDGVGARGWDDRMADMVVPYFEAMERACWANHVEFWANIECFKLVSRTSSGPKEFAPADAQRLSRQLTAVAPFVRRIVTFDFFHYMSPYRQDERARKLYEDYVKAGVSATNSSSRSN